jgi:hypothetical protein
MGAGYSALPPDGPDMEIREGTTARRSSERQNKMGTWALAIPIKGLARGENTGCRPVTPNDRAITGYSVLATQARGKAERCAPAVAATRSWLV